MAPVDQRGDAGVDLCQRADQIAEIVVLGPVARREVAVDVLDDSRRVIHSTPMPRSAVSHVCICALTSPGITILSVASITSSAAASRLRPTASMRLPANQELAALEVADGWVERDQPAASDQHALHRVPSRSLTLRPMLSGPTISKRLPRGNRLEEAQQRREVASAPRTVMRGGATNEEGEREQKKSRTATRHRRQLEKSTVGTTVHLLPEESWRVKALAVQLRVSAHELLLMGLDRLLAENNLPPKVARSRDRRLRCRGCGRSLCHQ